MPAKRAEDLRVLLLGTVNSPHVVDLAEALEPRLRELVVAGWKSPALPPRAGAARLAPEEVMPPKALRSRVRWLRGLVRDVQPDVVHVQGAAMFAVAATYARARPRIVTALGTDVLSSRAIDRMRVRFVVRSADYVTGDSPVLVERMIERGAKREGAALIGWGVDLSAFTPGSRTDARRALGLPEDGRIVLSPRALAPVYNQDVVVAAFDELARGHADVRLVIKHLGADSALPPASAHPERVHVIGNVDAGRLPELYRAADVVVSVPSSDSAPRTVWEAMACGTPCVVSDLPWLDDMVERGEEALAVAVAPGDVARALESLLDDDARAAALAARGRALVEREHDRSAQMAKLLKLYESAARRSTASA